MTKLHKCLLIDAHYRRCYQSKGLMGERETITTMDCSRKSNTNNKNQARQKSSSGLATLSLLAVGWMLCDPTIRPLEASPEPSGPQPYRSQSPPPSAPRQHQQRYHNPPPPPSIKKQRPPPGQSSEAPPHARPYPQAQMELLQQLDQLKERDTCGSIYTSKMHGYDVREYKVVTKDKYELKLHRLIPPEDYMPRSPDAPPQPKKKPYLLIHGLIGTSASYVLNVDDHYKAPPKSYQAVDDIFLTLKSQLDVFQHNWRSTAQQLQQESSHKPRDKWQKGERVFSKLEELVYDGDELNFAHEFRQAYQKFQLPKEALSYTTNSMAFTLANFGYDVWLINLRGNEYSRGFDGPKTAALEEYWNFTIETVVKEDLLATINFIMDKVQCQEPIGVVTYSYSGAYVMNLLRQFPKYVERLAPVVMLAPTVLSASKERGRTKYAFRLFDKLLNKNGPFPTVGRSFNFKKSSFSSLISFSRLDEKLESLACSLPIASKLCRLVEIALHGKTKQVSTLKGLLTSQDRSATLMARDNQCGQTSKAILHQIFQNIKHENIPDKFHAYQAVRPVTPEARKRAANLRRPIILIHSDSDEVSTPSEVKRIRQTALKPLTLLDYSIESTQFGHTDFLFSKRNQFLVNAEVVRQVLLYDYLMYRPTANRRRFEVPRGF